MKEDEDGHDLAGMHLAGAVTVSVRRHLRALPVRCETLPQVIDRAEESEYTVHDGLLRVSGCSEPNHTLVRRPCLIRN